MSFQFLTSYVKFYGALAKEPVSNTQLVIHGDEVAANLQNWYINSAEGGGIYHNCARNVRLFFGDLKRCNISPVVIMNGYCDDVNTKSDYLRNGAELIETSLQDVAKEDAEDISCYYTRTVFVQTLRSLGVPYAVCPSRFNTLPLVELARRLNCPVMSNGNNVLTLGVTVVKLPRRRAVLELRGGRQQDGQTGFHMPCEVFRPQRFSQKLGVSEEMMPLIAVLLGTYGTPKSMFRLFFKALEAQFPSMLDEQFQQHDSLMRWLTRQPSRESAIEQVRGFLSEEDWKAFTNIIRFADYPSAISLEFLRDAGIMILPPEVTPAVDEDNVLTASSASSASAIPPSTASSADEPARTSSEPAPSKSKPAPSNPEPAPFNPEPAPSKSEPAPASIEPALSNSESATCNSQLTPNTSGLASSTNKPTSSNPELAPSTTEFTPSSIERAPSSPEPAPTKSGFAPSHSDSAPTTSEPARDTIQVSSTTIEPTKTTPESALSNTELALSTSESASTSTEPATSSREPAPSNSEPSPSNPEPAPCTTEPAAAPASSTPGADFECALPRTVRGALRSSALPRAMLTLRPPALRQTMARYTANRCASRAVFGMPWYLWPMLDDADQPSSSLAPVPLLVRLSALLGAPSGLRVMFSRHERQLRQMLVCCAWRAPLLERELLGGEAACHQAALSVLKLRQEAAVSIPPLLQLPVAALIEWRRVTAGRSGRHQVRALLMTLLAMSPVTTPPEALGLSASAAREWRAHVWPLRYHPLTADLFSRPALHLYNEYQDVFRAALSVNEMLNMPLQQLDIANALHLPLTMQLGFVTGSDQGDSTEAGEEVKALVNRLTDIIEEESKDVTPQDDCPGICTSPWVPSSRWDHVPEPHPDLEIARALTSILNKLTISNAPRLLPSLRHLAVTTEYGLYVLVDVMFRATQAAPEMMEVFADACSELAELQAPSDHGDGQRVSFIELLNARLKLDCGMFYGEMISSKHLVQHLELAPTPEERWRQLRQLTNCWRAAERRRDIILLLVGSLACRSLVTPHSALAWWFHRLNHPSKPLAVQDTGIESKQLRRAIRRLSHAMEKPGDDRKKEGEKERGGEGHKGGQKSDRTEFRVTMRPNVRTRTKEEGDGEGDGETGQAGDGETVEEAEGEGDTVKGAEGK